MLERSLYRSIIAGALSEGWALYRIGDGAAGKKPFDIGGVSPLGRAVAIEVKEDDTIQGAMKRLEDHQSAWLHQYQKVGAIGIVLIKCPGSSDIHAFTGLGMSDFKPGKLCLVNSRYIGWQKLVE